MATQPRLVSARVSDRAADIFDAAMFLAGVRKDQEFFGPHLEEWAAVLGERNDVKEALALRQRDTTSSVIEFPAGAGRETP